MSKKKKSNKIHIPRALKRLFPDLKKIIDAKSSINVSVQSNDCKKAEPLNPSHCAMAQAAKRQFKIDNAVIGISTSYLIKGIKRLDSKHLRLFEEK